MKYNNVNSIKTVVKSCKNKKYRNILVRQAIVRFFCELRISNAFETITSFFLAKKPKKIVQFVRFFITHTFSWARPMRDPAQSGHTEFEGLFLFTAEEFILTESSVSGPSTESSSY